MTGTEPHSFRNWAPRHAFVAVGGERAQASVGQGAHLAARPGQSSCIQFSQVWEISIKNGLERSDFNVDSRRLWRMLLVNGYRELPVTSEHTFAVNDLPPLHKEKH